MIGCKALWASTLLVLLTTVFGQYIQIPNNFKGIPTHQSQGSALGVTSPDLGQDRDFFIGDDSRDANIGTQNFFGTAATSSGGLNIQSDRSFQDLLGDDGVLPSEQFPGTMFSPNTQSDRSFEDIFGDYGVLPGGQFPGTIFSPNTQSDRSFQNIFGDDGTKPGRMFPGTISHNFLVGQPGTFFGGGSNGGVPSPGRVIIQPQFGAERDFGVNFPGLRSQTGFLQQQFGGDTGLGINFGGIPTPGVIIQDQFAAGAGLGNNIVAGSAFQFGGDANIAGGLGVGSAFQPLSPSFAGSSRVIEGRSDVTLTRTITEDRFVTTTNVAFVKEPRTATIFSFVTQTAVTTEVVPTPVDRSVIISTSLVTGVPVTVTVTDVRSEFQYVTRTEVQYITLTHTSRRFTPETLTTTVTRVQTVPSTVVRTRVSTVTTTYTDIRTITSKVFTGY